MTFKSLIAYCAVSAFLFSATNNLTYALDGPGAQCAAQRAAMFSAQNHLAHREKAVKNANKKLAKIQETEKKAEAREMSRMEKYEASMLVPLREPLSSLRATCAALAGAGACTVDLAAQVDQTCGGLLADEARYRKLAEVLAKMLQRYFANRDSARAIIGQAAELVRLAEIAVIEAQSQLIAAENSLTSCLSENMNTAIGGTNG